MKIVETEKEIIIYPLLPETDVEQEDDYCIAMDETGIIVNGYMWNEYEIQQVIDGLETILELSSQRRMKLNEDLND